MTKQQTAKQSKIECCQLPGQVHCQGSRCLTVIYTTPFPPVGRKSVLITAVKGRGAKNIPVILGNLVKIYGADPKLRDSDPVAFMGTQQYVVGE